MAYILDFFFFRMIVFGVSEIIDEQIYTETKEGKRIKIRTDTSSISPNK